MYANALAEISRLQALVANTVTPVEQEAPAPSANRDSNRAAETDPSTEDVTARAEAEAKHIGDMAAAVLVGAEGEGGEALLFDMLPEEEEDREEEEEEAKSASTAPRDIPVAQAPSFFYEPPKTILKPTLKAISDFDMIRDGDRVLVFVSGGKVGIRLLLPEADVFVLRVLRLPSQYYVRPS